MLLLERGQLVGRSLDDADTRRRLVWLHVAVPGEATGFKYVDFDWSPFVAPLEALGVQLSGGPGGRERRARLDALGPGHGWMSKLDAGILTVP